MTADMQGCGGNQCRGDAEATVGAAANSPGAPLADVTAVRGDGGTGFDLGVAHPARVYACWLGGKDHFPADREAATEVMKVRPEVVAGARANRAFLARVVRFLAAECGIRQFLDIGTGLPAPAGTHEVAEGVAAGCRVVYVDNDPLVLTHARALLTCPPPGACDYVDADVRDVGTVVREAARTLDFSQPVGVLLLALLHFLPDADDPAGVVAALVEAASPGSYVALSHLTADFAPQQVGAAAEAYRKLVPAGVTPRSHSQVSRLFGGLPLVAPGVVPVAEWRPSEIDPSPQSADLYAGVVRVPGRAA
jgi:hypothetical protein